MFLVAIGSVNRCFVLSSVSGINLDEGQEKFIGNILETKNMKRKLGFYKFITCAKCGLEKKHYAKGLCLRCYQNSRYVEKPRHISRIFEYVDYEMSKLENTLRDVSQDISILRKQLHTNRLNTNSSIRTVDRLRRNKEES